MIAVTAMACEQVCVPVYHLAHAYTIANLAVGVDATGGNTLFNHHLEVWRARRARSGRAAVVLAHAAAFHSKHNTMTFSSAHNVAREALLGYADTIKHPVVVRASLAKSANGR